jgi:hypothetical protein
MRVPEVAGSSRLLRRIGTVVNIGGLSPEDTVSALRVYSPDGVVAYGDKDIAALSFVASELGLDYHTPEVARLLVDKLCQREALRNGGVPSPLCWALPLDASSVVMEALAASVKFPAVLKPRTATGSKYVTLVTGGSDLVQQVATLPRRAGGETGMFVEQYLPSLAARSRKRFADFVRWRVWSHRAG